MRTKQETASSKRELLSSPRIKALNRNKFLG
uniref:Uncharacterized protein n=1 Tax=Rhizophora mucronata TaxID=61149 RepID=A0A2P2R138_RHIMU